MTKPKIKVLPIDQAEWAQPWMFNTGIQFAYRVYSPYQTDNQIIGARKGTKKEVEVYAKQIGKRFTVNVDSIKRGRSAINMFGQVRFNQRLDGL